MPLTCVWTVYSDNGSANMSWMKCPTAIRRGVFRFLASDATPIYSISMDSSKNELNRLEAFRPRLNRMSRRADEDNIFELM